jgi:hypothetical protein
VLALPCSEPPGNATHWTGRAVAKAAGVSLRSVQRIWEAHRLQPHRLRSFKKSNDPDFAEKVEDVVALARRRSVRSSQASGFFQFFKYLLLKPLLRGRNYNLVPDRSDEPASCLDSHGVTEQKGFAIQSGAGNLGHVRRYFHQLELAEDIAVPSMPNDPLAFARGPANDPVKLVVPAGSLHRASNNFAAQLTVK